MIFSGCPNSFPFARGKKKKNGGVAVGFSLSVQQTDLDCAGTVRDTAPLAFFLEDVTYVVPPLVLVCVQRVCARVSRATPANAAFTRGR